MSTPKGKGLFFQRSIHRTELDGPLQGAPRMKEPFVPTPNNPLIISPSEIAQFLRCRLQWNWDKRVGLRSKKVSMPRVNGIIVHAAKEEFYQLTRAERTPEGMQRAAKAAFKNVKEVPVTSKDRELASAMLDGYTRWVRHPDNENNDRSIGKREVFPEWQFVLPLVKDRSILIRGKIDELFEPRIYKRVLAMDESKTKNSISFDMMDMDSQLTTYLWAMWKASTTGECPLPKPLQSRRYDRYIAWRTVLRRQMPGPRVKAALFARESIERSPDDLIMWERDTLRIVRDMLDAAIYPTRRESCRYDCDFYELCLVRGNKHDLKAIIEEQYTISSPNK
ncbi:MAG: PD-(D/E)XK nuclease family protein [Actinobacteria bacterium]|nr:PD-(D/E)XK nuclease family protein [Actinomycetota bacterium]